MGTLKIVWKKRAVLRFEQIEEWYVREMGNGAATKFAKGIYDTVQTLSHSPQIGVLDEKASTSQLKYGSYLIRDIVLFIDLPPKPYILRLFVLL